MKFILAKKIEMTQIWQGDNVVAVTKLQAGPCLVSQLKTIDKDGYEAVQIAFGERKTKNIKKPQIGHLKKAKVNVEGKKTYHFLKEFRAKDIAKDLEMGDIVKVDTFAVGDEIEVIGTSKGKGFQGVVRRHGFKGTNEQHGNKDQSRMPGSVGATGPAHVFKGTRMAGRMGGDRVTVKSLEVIQIDEENNLIYIKGGVPGARNSLVLISGAGELKVSKATAESKAEVEEIKNEEVVEEQKEAVKEEAKAETQKEALTPEEVEKEVVEAKEKVEEAKKTQE